MLAKEPADRYPSMHGVVQALEQLRSQLSEPSIRQPAAAPSSGPASGMTFLRDLSLAPRTTLRGGKKPDTTKRSAKVQSAEGSGKRRGLWLAVAGGAVFAAALGGLLVWQPWKSHAPGGTESKPATTATSATVAARPLDNLDPTKIPATERYDWQPKELVAVLGERRGSHGVMPPGNGYSIAVKFSSDGSRLVSAGHCFEGLRLWDPRSLQLRAALASRHKCSMACTFPPTTKCWLARWSTLRTRSGT